MSEGIGDLDGLLGRAVMHALELAAAEAGPPAELTCNGCGRVFAVRLPAVGVMFRLHHEGQSYPVTVVCRFCAPCRAEIEPEGGDR